MSITTMPLFTDPVYTYTINLGDIPYKFRFAWNDRATGWFMDIRTDADAPILIGHRLVPQFPMCLDYAFQGYGLNGYFALMPINAAQGAILMKEPQELAERFELLYITED